MTQNNDSHQHIYIELDALLDTRLGAMWQMSPATADAMLYLKYHDRVTDDFTHLIPDFDLPTYIEHYAKRDVSTLKTSRPTNMVFVINQIFNDLTEDALTGPHVDGTELTINTYPYQLNVSELETLKDMVSTIIGDMTGINTIYEPLTALTMAKIKTNYSAVILYHFSEWVAKLDVDDLKQHKSPRIKVLAPTLFTVSVPTEKDLKDTDGAVLNPFGLLEIEFLEFFSLIFTDVRFYSIVELA